ncbi:hypothetical protein M2152_001656 [Microbacteriaceae bacterium SG_E_30_P1]|uniref:Uncharacterized protein n=1 Tax=Antiquaquibacter oligotrophicus TaxID=2880260 RepID=A0ABT6KNN0_9MICO|nr:DUF6157 family protein [Antiquaquibacter oligotrophicus]MDH6181474.1 hypothetical protein [Antiquaquibacter oligotrophicus]UDF12836.1 DUF6157 family protein [Antiquaquibacter oligotrophicus]
MHSTNYFDTFILVADDSPALEGVVPPTRPSPSVAEMTYRMIAQNPYGHTSDDVIFTVWADRRGIPHDERVQAREEFFAKGQPCLRSSDLGKRYGWGIHSDSEGRVALVAVDTPEYAMLAAGSSPEEGRVRVTRAMRSKR